MRANLKAQQMGSFEATRSLTLGLAVLWMVVTAIGWFVITAGSGAGCLLILSPVIAAILGTLQRRVLKLGSYDIQTGWALRTALGWLAGLLALFIVLQVMNSVHHFQPEYYGWGLFVVAGDQVEVATQVGGWALMGALVGAFQWFAPLQLHWPAPTGGLATESSPPSPSQTMTLPPGPRSTFRSFNHHRQAVQMVWWTAVNALAWGAAALVSWAVFKAFAIGYEPICVDCVARSFWCGMAGGVVIAVVTGLALWHRPIGTLLGLLAAFTIGIVAAYLVLNNRTVGLAGTMGIFDTSSLSSATPTPVSPFDAREMRPSRVLESSHGETKHVAFSKDGTLLAAQKDEWEQGYVVKSEILIWRTSDWDQIGTIPIVDSNLKEQQTAQAFVENSPKFTVISGTLVPVIFASPSPLPQATINYPGGMQATATLSADGKIHVRGPVNGKTESELNTIDLNSGLLRSPDGGLEIVTFTWSTTELQRTSDSSVVTYLRYPPEDEGISPDRLVATFSPDGRYIAGGSQYGGVWLWEVPR